MWEDASSGDKSLIGHHVVAIHPDALMSAVGELARVAGAPLLKVRSGEHLAALLLTALCGQPVAIDTHGEVDLAFDRRASGSRNWPFGDHDRANVEIKSFAGGFRHADSRLKFGDSFNIKIRTAADILDEASGQIERAIRALSRKTDQGTSKNVFLVIHLFDAFAIERHTDGPLIGHLLPHLSAAVDLDTLWVLWHPDMLVVWSTEEQRWSEVLFTSEHDPPRPSPDDGLAPLQQAESAFLEASGFDGGSPWIFGFRPNTV